MDRPSRASSVDPGEIRRFSRLAGEWWDPSGKFRPLHAFNPVRIRYIRDTILSARPERDPGRPLRGLEVVDIGCGGGLVSEPLARLGASVTGIDASGENIAAARIHASQVGLAIDYRKTSAEELARDGGQARFDVALVLEVVEHVADAGSLFDAVATLLKPGGLVFVTTLNRTATAFLLAIIGAEYVLRWLPRGTHDFRKFVTPAELANRLRQSGLVPDSLSGFSYSPFTGEWRNSENCAVNYVMTGHRTSQTAGGQGRPPSGGAAPPVPGLCPDARLRCPDS